MNLSSTEWTASEGRKFAFPVGTAFFVLAGILWWRQHETPMIVTAGLGALLYVSGALIPAYLGPVHRGWMRMALVISRVTTPVFMSIVYFLVLTPTGVIMRAVGRKPLSHSLNEGSFWHSTEGRPDSDLSRQF